MLLDLIQGAALLLALSLLYGLSLRLRHRNALAERVVSGVMFGLVCVAGMAMSVEQVPGVIFDARTVVLAMAGAFGGPVVGAIAAVFAGGWRVYLGGTGMLVGLGTIVIATLLGIAFWYGRRARRFDAGFMQFVILGFLVHVVSVLLFLQLPAEVAERVLDEIALPFIVVFTLATAFLGFLLRDVEQRFVTEAALQDSESRLRSTVADLRTLATAFEAHEGIIITDSETIAIRVNNPYSEMTGYSRDAVIGRIPRILQADCHEPAFYDALWEAVSDEGSWSGEVQTRRADGSVLPVWLGVSAVRDADRNISNYVLTLTDISRQKEMEERVRTLAFYDVLTRLPNRRLMLDRLHQALRLSSRHDAYGALLFIDIDNFKGLNDTSGHDSGDQLLVSIAERLRATVRSSDSVARLGGDEFVIMLESLSSEWKEAANEAARVGDKLLTELSQPYMLKGRSYHTSCSIGVTLFHHGCPDADELMKQSDLAMYEAKNAGRNALRFFSPEMQVETDRRAALDQDLRSGLQSEQFEIHYQFQVDRDGTRIGMEALLRWRHPGHGLIAPTTFIPLVEETGVILPLGSFVLTTVCRQIAQWQQLPGFRDVTVAVNVSARQLHDPGFVNLVESVVEKTGASPEHLQLEVTESVLLEDIDAAIAKMTHLCKGGITFSLDDFGTGYSSLAYLKKLPLQQLKIDQSFVRDVLTDPSDVVIVRAIISLAENFSLFAMAEGVENEAQRQLLERLGCDGYQGYLFAYPVPAADITFAE